MMNYVKHEKEAGREPFMDPLNPITPVKDDQGVPIGGIGAGSITRGWRGDFVRWYVYIYIFMHVCVCVCTQVVD